ncbi:MAG: hypothetical protein WCD49_01710 [Candidatus Acidiferrales bacterium]
MLSIAVFLLGLFAEHFIGRGSGLPTSLSAGMIAVAVWWRWDLSNRLWFWAAVVAIAALHVPLLLFVHWTTRWIPAAISMPFCMVDALLILKIFDLGEKFIDSR